MTDPVFKQPASDSAERAVLGCVFLKPESLNHVAQKLAIHDFYYPLHRLCYELMLGLTDEMKPIEFQTVRDKILATGKLDDASFMDFYISITTEPFYVENIEEYISIVLEQSMKRQLALMADSIKNRALDDQEKAGGIIESVESKLLEITDTTKNTDLVRIGDRVDETFDRISQAALNKGKLTGLSTGFRDLDHMLSGLQKSDFVLIAARPSMGKTALAVNIALNVVKIKDEEGNYPHHVAIFSLEMSVLQLIQRLLAAEAKVDLQKIITGDLTADAWEDVLHAIERLRNYPMFIDDTSAITLRELRSKCRKLKMQYKNLDLIVIDYLQLMSAEDTKRNENRQQEISTISRGLKALAKEMDCPVLSLSQLSRKTESREGARPVMSDMRESGAIEQDADVVMLLYRESYYKELPAEENRDITEVIVAKHRNGPTGIVELQFIREQTRFGDLSYGDDPNV